MDHKTFVPLVLSLIDEGRFLSESEFRLAELQKAMLEFRRKHGDKAKKAKGKLTIELGVCCEEPADGLFSIASKMKMTLPLPPTKVTVAMSAGSEDGECLFVRPSGSSEDSPVQGRLTTDDGRVVDQKTGKAKA